MGLGRPVPEMRQGISASGHEAGVVPPPYSGSFLFRPETYSLSSTWASRQVPWKSMTRNIKASSQCSPWLILSEMRLENFCFDFRHVTYCFLQWCFKHLIGSCSPRTQSCLWILGETSEQGREKFSGFLQTGQWVQCLSIALNMCQLIPSQAGKDLRSLCVKVLVFREERGDLEWVIGHPETWNPTSVEWEGAFSL